MKKLLFTLLFFMSFYVQGSTAFVNTDILYFLEFFQVRNDYFKTHLRPLTTQASMQIEVHNSERYEVRFSIQDDSLHATQTQHRLILPFVYTKVQRGFNDLITTFIAYHSTTTLQAVTFLKLLSGKKSGTILFSGDTFTIQEQ